MARTVDGYQSFRPRATYSQLTVAPALIRFGSAQRESL